MDVDGVQDFFSNDEIGDDDDGVAGMQVTALEQTLLHPQQVLVRVVVELNDVCARTPKWSDRLRHTSMFGVKA